MIVVHMVGVLRCSNLTGCAPVLVRMEEDILWLWKVYIEGVSQKIRLFWGTVVLSLLGIISASRLVPL